MAGAASPSLAQDLARGEELFELCATCHGPQGEGNEMYLAPAIGGMPLWYLERQLQKFREGIRGTHFDDIEGMRMLAMARSLRTERGDDLKDVAAYTASLPSVKPPPTLTGGDAERGKVHYATCGACHGQAGEGVQATNGPPVANQSDWYLLSSLVRFKSGVRGSNPSDPNGAVMRGMSGVVPDEQAMKDVIAYMIGLSGE
ncbi:MAG: c-type cytochrome [Myxococcota bacterium]